jgi:hypothetical protein
MRYVPKAILRSRDRPILIWWAPPFLVIAAFLQLAFWSVMIASGSSGISLLFASLILVGGAAVDIGAAVGFARERMWARWVFAAGSVCAIVIASVVMLAIPSSDVSFAVDLAGPTVFLVFTLWYLFGYGPVRAYYARLARKR